MSRRPDHILSASTNLLGIALVIIAGLNVSHVAREVFADEVAWGAALCLMTSCVLSYIALRGSGTEAGYERWADRIFLLGLLCLFAAIVVLAIQSR